MLTLYRHFRTQAEIDAQYNAGASVPDYAAFLGQYADRSAEERSGNACHLHIAYGPTLAETLDIFPASQPGAPVLVFLHGGYWRSLAASDFSFVARGPRAQGFTTVVVDYALCPWVPIEEIVRQVRASVAWVYRHIHLYGGDPARIGIAGHSAGGHLAMMALLSEWKECYGLPADLLRAAISISGLHELEPLRHSYLQPVLQLDHRTVARNSPTRLAAHVNAPVLLAWGQQESEEFASQARDFAAAMVRAESDVTTFVVPGAHHFSVLDGFLDPGSRFCTWLAAALAGSSRQHNVTPTT
jgi:arylformamidase